MNKFHQALTHSQSKLASRGMIEPPWLQLIAKMPAQPSFTSRPASKIEMTRWNITNPWLRKKARDTVMHLKVMDHVKTILWEYRIPSSKRSKGRLMNRNSIVKEEKRNRAQDLEALFPQWDKTLVSRLKSHQGYMAMILKNKFLAFTPCNLINWDLKRVLWTHIEIKKRLERNLIKRRSNH